MYLASSGSFSRFSLVAQQVSLVNLYCPLVSDWIVTIVKPVLNEFKIITDTPTVNPDPVDAFY
jgi:hypothetical protein